MSIQIEVRLLFLRQEMKDDFLLPGMKLENASCRRIKMKGGGGGSWESRVVGEWGSRIFSSSVPVVE